MKSIISNINLINKNTVKGVLIGTVISVVINAVILLISSFVVVKTSTFPASLITYISLISLMISSFAGGYVSGSIIKKLGLMNGAIVGLILFIIIFITGLINNSSITILSLYKLLLILISSSIAGIISVNKKEKIKIK